MCHKAGLVITAGHRTKSGQNFRPKLTNFRSNAECIFINSKTSPTMVIMSLAARRCVENV